MSSAASESADVNYLLSAQVLLDLCSTTNNPARAWSKPVPSTKLRLSVLTVSQVRAFVRSVSGTADGERAWARLADLLAKIKADGGDPLLFGEGASTAWQSLMNEPTLGNMDQIERLFYATAFSEGLCVVEYEHAHSSALGPLGIKVRSLGQQG